MGDEERTPKRPCHNNSRRRLRRGHREATVNRSIVDGFYPVSYFVVINP